MCGGCIQRCHNLSRVPGTTVDEDWEASAAFCRRSRPAGGWIDGESPERAADVQEYLSRTMAEARTADLMTVAEWNAEHPGEVETPEQAQQRESFRDAWNTGEKGLERHWCLRSTAEIQLAGGIAVRRIALFYQPLVNENYDGPLPPLPTESGAALRQHGCRLLRILSEFEGVSDPRALAETLAREIAGQPSVELAPVGEDAVAESWAPVFTYGFMRGYGTDDGIPVDGDWTVYEPGMYRTRSPIAGRELGVVVRWRAVSLDYGPPPRATLNPLAGQPWVALRAAMLAGMPKEITLKMLSFLAPQVGGWIEQPPLYCHRDVVPVLRSWLAQAAKAPANQHAAAVVMADQVANRLPDCAEFAEEPHNYAFESQSAAENAWPALEKELGALGIDMGESAHRGEVYSGSLLKQVPRLTPTGEVEEVYRVALLDQDQCEWNGYGDADCTGFNREAEKFLADYRKDAWTPSIELMLAQAYSIMEAQSEADDEVSAAQREDWRKKEDQYLRAWYAGSRNEQSRALVWQEIWNIDAGGDPWLLVPEELRN